MKLGPSWKNAGTGIKRQNPVRILLFTRSEAVQLCIAGPEANMLNQWDLNLSCPYPPGNAWTLSSHLFWGKEGKVCLSLFFPEIHFWIWEAFLLEQILSHKKVPFQQVSIFRYKQIHCGKIPTKLYFGVLQKKSCKGELLEWHLQRDTRMILYRVQIKWHGGI